MGDYQERLLRQLDGSLYAYRCSKCGSVWKIYQQETHDANCCVLNTPQGDTHIPDERPGSLDAPWMEEPDPQGDTEQ